MTESPQDSKITVRIMLSAHLLSGASGYRSAGIHQYIENLLRHLPTATPPEWVLTAFVGAQYTGAFDGITMRRAGMNTERPSQRILWEQGAQPPQLLGADLVHALAFVAPLVMTSPHVVTVYDLSFIHHPGRLPAARRRYLQTMTGITCRRARRVIAISHSTARDVAAVYGIDPEKIDVAAPGYDRALYRPYAPAEIEAFKRAKGLPERFWLFVGTLEPRKNLVMLLRAYAALPLSERLPLILAGGKGWDTQPIFDAVRQYGLSDDVQFPGFLSTDELPFWYNSADAFIYPSVYEGFGLPVLEAMACGKPVLTSNVSSLPEVGGDAALCLPPHDTDAWTEGLRRVGSDGAWRADARERGFAQSAQFSWDATAQVVIESYRRALRH